MFVPSGHFLTHHHGAFPSGVVSALPFEDEEDRDGALLKSALISLEPFRDAVIAKAPVATTATAIAVMSNFVFLVMKNEDKGILFVFLKSSILLLL
jgi:hypothetical protein